MTSSPASIINLLVSERIKIRAQTGTRASAPPPPAVVSSPKPGQAIGKRAEFGFVSYTPPFRDALDPTSYIGANRPTLVKDFFFSRSNQNPVAPPGTGVTTSAQGQTYAAQIGGPSPSVASVTVSQGISTSPSTNPGSGFVFGGNLDATSSYAIGASGSANQDAANSY